MQLSKLSESKHEFSVVMVKAPDNLSKSIKTWAKNNIDDDIVDPTEGRENYLHVTALFGIHSTSPDKTKELVEGFGDIEVELGELSLFEPDEYDVLKIDINSDKLHDLHKILKEQPHTLTHKTYNPHLTIAYLKKGEGHQFIGNKNFVGRKFITDEIMFSPPDGNRVMIPLS